ncbi:unnamed protein product [Hymenolepis diminuta]|uniref:Uncharacterized protein n=1 Tax=Hymenolepis diminuta TaxID=6216 RepID=A0A564Z5U7_HYMDI|nr:unnamed protein product [Hymenolepis diminuta]
MFIKTDIHVLKTEVLLKLLSLSKTEFQNFPVQLHKLNFLMSKVQFNMLLIDK